jgi:hypothetical protein
LTYYKLIFSLTKIWKPEILPAEFLEKGGEKIMSIISLLFLALVLGAVLVAGKAFAGDGDLVKTSLLMHLQDIGGQHSKASFGADSTVTLAKAFLNTYSDAGIVGASNVDELVCAGVAPVAASNVDEKVRIIAKDSVTGDKIRFVVSAHKGLTMVHGEKGERVDPTSGAAICAAWKTANALPNALVFLRGTPTQKA